MSPLRMWTDLMSNMMAAGTAFAPEATPPDAFRQMRSQWLDAWATFWENYSRSPQFLELMKESFGASLGVRKQINDYLGEMHHQFQGVSRQDIDALMQAIRHVEQRLVDESERITRRMNDLGYRLDQLQSRAPESSRSRSSGDPAGLGPVNP